ncbi:hypothetical protein ACFL6W_07070 [Thermodesulfobacteriota bacterium]
MDKEKLKYLAQDKRYISGIYNYCDRWCERCPQTARCINYAIGIEEFSDPKTRDINNEAFWKKMSEMMQETLEMLNDMIVSVDVDPEQLINTSDEDEHAIKEAAENHFVCRMAREYGDMAQEWFDGAQDLFIKPEKEISHRMDVNLEPDSIADNMDVILWYQHQIYVKLMRAVSGSLEESSSFNDDNYASDSDGSAKVALIGIDRSIPAWGSMSTTLPGLYANNIKNILIHLDQLRKNVEETFPCARKFIRPGFDNIDLNS